MRSSRGKAPLRMTPATSDKILRWESTAQDDYPWCQMRSSEF